MQCRVRRRCCIRTYCVFNCCGSMQRPFNWTIMHRGNHLPRHTDTVDLLLLNMLGNRPPLIVAYNVVLLLSHKAELRRVGGCTFSRRKQTIQRRIGCQNIWITVQKIKVKLKKVVLLVKKKTNKRQTNRPRPLWQKYSSVTAVWKQKASSHCRLSVNDGSH